MSKSSSILKEKQRGKHKNKPRLRDLKITSLELEFNFEFSLEILSSNENIESIYIDCNIWVYSHLLIVCFLFVQLFLFLFFSAPFWIKWIWSSLKNVSTEESQTELAAFSWAVPCPWNSAHRCCVLWPAYTTSDETRARFLCVLGFILPPTS